MAFRRDPLDELVVPDGTEAKEVALETDGDVLVGARSTVEFGVRGRNILAGESVEFGGDIEAEADCRLDMWCDVADNVLVGQDAYIGERVHIGGEMKVAGDLDIGDDVEIDEGFEANGWIVIRNPMPTIVFLFVYLKQLLLIGEEDAAQRLVSQLVDDEDENEDAEPAPDPLIVPRNATVSDDAWRVSTPATIGDDCRLHGNIRATELDVGVATEIFGSLRAKGDITVGRGTVVHGDVTSKDGDVRIDDGAHVRGDVACENCALSAAAEIDGTIRARGATTITDAEAEAGAGAEVEADAEVEAESDEQGDPKPAVVPLGEGVLPVEPTPAIRPIEEEPRSTDSEPEPAIVPLSEASLEWDAVGEDRARRNGAGDDVAELIAEAEER